MAEAPPLARICAYLPGGAPTQLPSSNHHRGQIGHQSVTSSLALHVLCTHRPTRSVLSASRASCGKSTVPESQNLSTIPECSLKCIRNTCDVTDFSCVCKNIDSPTSDVTLCVIKECGADGAASTFSPTVSAHPLSRR